LGARRPISRVASTPSIPGIAMSISTTSGVSASTILNALRAVLASPTTS